MYNMLLLGAFALTSVRYSLSFIATNHQRRQRGSNFQKVWPKRNSSVSQFIKRSTSQFSTNGSKAAGVKDPTGGVDDDDDEDESPLSNPEPRTLEALKFKNYPVSVLKSMEERGQLVLRPFYQRGYKWSQKQASLWIESILRGYPCLPEVTLLETEDEEGDTEYATFDGQQRLTSIMLFVKGERGGYWKANREQQKKGTENNFALEGLTMLSELEHCSFKDLSKKHQNIIQNYDVRCAIIPPSWSMADYIEFFKRIQGGGTPMSDHELRRAIARGPFTELLDTLASHQEVKRAFSACQNLKQDKIQELILRYYSLVCSTDTAQFGKPSMAQQGLETMKRLNKEMEHWEAQYSRLKESELVDPLIEAFEFATALFDENEVFRRVAPLMKQNKAQQQVKVWMDSSNVNAAIFLCMIYCFSRDKIRKRHKDLLENREAVRDELITLMQLDPNFTDTLRASGTSERLRAMEEKLYAFIRNLDDDSPTTRPISRQTRLDMIANALQVNAVCPICKEALGPFEEHLHVDHIKPKSKGGSNDFQNLQVVHKTCNLRKSDKILDHK